MTPIYFAPLQGYVDNTYRRLHHALFGGVACYYTPFIRIEKGAPRHQDITRLRDSIEDGTPLVPQIIFNSIEEFKTLTEAIKSLGYNHIDLNLGCPFPMQTRKGRGAALIGNSDVMDCVADLISQDSATSYSVKMRLGMNDPEEWKALMPTLNSIRLEHITVHPRIAKQLYQGDLYESQFKQLLMSSKNPIIWNGDIQYISDIKAIAEQYPSLKGIMIGRGLLSRPSLASEWNSGVELDAKTRLRRILDFHNSILEEYKSQLNGQSHLLNKLAAFWEYLEPEIGHKTYKAIRKTSNLDRYMAVIATIDCN